MNGPMATAGLIAAGVGAVFTLDAGKRYNATSPAAQEAVNVKIERTLDARGLQEPTAPSVFGTDDEMQTRYDTLTDPQEVKDDVQTIHTTNAMGRSGTAFLIGGTLLTLGSLVVPGRKYWSNPQPSIE